MFARISLSITILLSLLYLPFWVTAALGIVGMVFFHFYWEAPFVFLISDILYGVISDRLFNFVFISFIISVLVLLIIEAAKKKLKFY